MAFEATVESATVADIDNQGFSINENLDVGAFAGQIKDDGGELPTGVRFTLINGQDSDAFLVSGSGEITVKDNTKLDYETVLLPTVEVDGKQVPFLTFQVEVEVDVEAQAEVEVEVETNNGVAPATIDIFMLLRDVNDAPEATTPGNTQVTLGQTATVQISATDEDIHGDSNTDQPSWSVITYELDSPPAGASINANGLFTWTPTETGTTTITVKVSNSFTGDLEQVVQFNVTVNPSGGFNEATQTTSKPPPDPDPEPEPEPEPDPDPEPEPVPVPVPEPVPEPIPVPESFPSDPTSDPPPPGFEPPSAGPKPADPDGNTAVMKIMSEIIAFVKCGNQPQGPSL